MSALVQRAAVQTGVTKNRVLSDWIALKSGRSTDMIVRGKKRPKADICCDVYDHAIVPVRVLTEPAFNQ